MTSHDPRPLPRLLPEADAALSAHRPGGGVLAVRRRRSALSRRGGGAFVANLGTASGRSPRRWPAGRADGLRERHRVLQRPGRGARRRDRRRSPGDLELVYPLSSGSEAVEAALKLARQYWVETGQPARQKIISLSPGYHGNTLLALSASAREHYKTYFRDWLVDVVRVPAPYAVPLRVPRRRRRSARLQRRGARGGDPSRRARHRRGASSPSRSAAPPRGASVPAPDYWRRVRAACDRHGVLFVADEVLTGAGRTGTWSALEPYGVVPDIMTLGKGIAGGYVPLSAVVAPRRLVDVLARGSGALLHAQTFSHHAMLCAAGVATLRYLREHALIERCADDGPGVSRSGWRRCASFPAWATSAGAGCWPASNSWPTGDPGAVPARRRASPSASPAAALEAGLVVWPNVGPGRRRERRSGHARAAFVIDRGADRPHRAARSARRSAPTVERMEPSR